MCKGGVISQIKILPPLMGPPNLEWASLVWALIMGPLVWALVVPPPGLGPSLGPSGPLVRAV